MPPILPYNEVTEGMQGTAVRIDARYDGRGAHVPRGDRRSGWRGQGLSADDYGADERQFIEHVGGVLQGMSGSPIYVDGRLVGHLQRG